jgi:hypothetical protein
MFGGTVFPYAFAGITVVHCGVGVERGAPRNGDVIAFALWLRV